MNYIVLARRWRPQQFEDIIGQDHVSKTLANAIDTGRIAHSFIFAGPRGVGKTTTARILAKALNCEKGPTSKPCNSCSICESITKGTSLDVLEIDGASNRGIDEIRNLRENIRFTPSQGKFRIYIIDEVHMLTKEAFNALLKTLEEPPGHAIFIFATTEIHRVPATILSRCQRYDFKRIPVKTIIEHLNHIAEAEKLQIESDALLQIAKKADGSMRDAQSILDQIISYSGTAITGESVRDALGIIGEEIYFEFTELIRTSDLKALLLLGQKVVADGYDIGEFLTGFEEHLRNLLVTKTLGTPEMISVSEHLHKSYTAVGKQFSDNDLLVYLQQVAELQNTIRWAPHPPLKFELGMLRMAKMPAAVEIEELLEKIDLVKKKDELKPIPENHKESAATAAPPALSLKILQNAWPEFIDNLREKRVNLATALELGQLKSFDNSNITLEYLKSDSFHISWLNKHKRLLEEMLQDRFAVPVKIQVATLENAENEINGTGKGLHKTTPEKTLKTDPLISKLIDDLGLELT
jgi:DNA polymerase-3 subunit gamma/tau